MKRYTVEYSERRWYELIVSARDEDEAVEEAQNIVDAAPTLWHYNDEDTYVSEYREELNEQ